MSQPKVSIGCWAFSFGPFADNPWTFPQVFQYAAETGYDGVEIDGFPPHPRPDDYDTPEKYEELLKQIEDHGLGISGLAADFSATPPSECETSDYVASVRKNLTFCKNMGINVLRVDTVSPPVELPPDEYEKRFNQLVTAWREAAKEAAKEGAVIVWEFEPGFWLNKPSEVKRTVEAVGHENFKLLFDTSHAYMGAVVGARQTGEKETLEGGVAEYARLVSDHIGHLHLIDSDGTLHNDETSTHTGFGKGHIDFKEALTGIKPVIKDMPWWCVDFCFNPETETLGKDGASFVKNLISEVL